MKKQLRVNALTHNFSVVILNILLTKFLIKIHQKDQILIKFNNINGLKNTRQQEDSFGKIFGQLGIAQHDIMSLKTSYFNHNYFDLC